MTDESAPGYYYRDQKSVVTRIPQAFGAGGSTSRRPEADVSFLCRQIIEGAKPHEPAAHQEILAKIGKVRVAVYGDFCLDAYWLLDPRGSRFPRRRACTRGPSRGTTTRWAGRPTVVANLAALKPGAIQAIGVIGDDIFGRELRRQLDELGVDTTNLIVQRENFDTVAFASLTSKTRRSRGSTSASSINEAQPPMSAAGRDSPRVAKG